MFMCEFICKLCIVITSPLRFAVLHMLGFLSESLIKRLFNPFTPEEFQIKDKQMDVLSEIAGKIPRPCVYYCISSVIRPRFFPSKTIPKSIFALYDRARFL